MDSLLNRIETVPGAGIFSLIMVWCGLALGHSWVVIQHSVLPMGASDTVLSIALGFGGFALVWAGMKRSENQATMFGWIGGTMIWCGWFEWTWRYSAHWLQIEPVLDQGMMILSPELLMIQATTLLVVATLIFLGANKDTRCRMFMWFHRNFGLRPDKMTPGYKRQHARTAALETVFLIWTIYLFAIWINDPRGIKYDSIAAMAITVAFFIWGVYLIAKQIKIRGLGAAFRYAIPVGHVCWLPIESFSRWGLYPEIWIKPGEYPVLMSGVLLVYLVGCALMFRTETNRATGSTATATA